MKIFVAFGYRPEDVWVKATLLPVIEAFGSEPMTGEDLWGTPLVGGVTARIQESDALVAVETSRDPMGDGTYNTHAWVLSELGVALAAGLKVLEIREVTVTPQAGIGAAYQQIRYDPAKRDACILEFVKAVGLWHRDQNVEPLLLPDDATRVLWKNRSQARCTYVIRRGDRTLPEQTATYYKREGALYVTLKSVRRGDLVSVRIEAGGEVWEADFHSVDARRIQLEKV